MGYDREYYLKYCSGQDTYDVLRPVRKTLKTPLYFVPKNASVSVLGFDNIMYYSRWRSLFSIVHGYEINPYAVELAREGGIGDFIHLQDISVRFEPVMRTNIALCYYVFEHLSDQQCANAIANLIRCAPVNIIQITTAENEHYKGDDSHCNPKTVPQWGKFLSMIYTRMKWKRVSSNPWCFMSARAFAHYERAKSKTETIVAKSWNSIMEET